MNCVIPQPVVVCAGQSAGECVQVPVTVFIASSCTSDSFSVLTYGEYQQAIASPFNLSVAAGGAIGVAIALVWAVAFAYKTLRDSIRGT